MWSEDGCSGEVGSSSITSFDPGRYEWGVVVFECAISDAECFAGHFTSEGPTSFFAESEPLAFEVE